MHYIIKYLMVFVLAELIAGALWIARRIMRAPAAATLDVPARVESETS